MSTLLFQDSTVFQGRRLHLSVTGSVAAYRACDLLRAWKRLGLHVSVTVSRGARQFVTPLLFSALGAMPVYEDGETSSDTCFAHLEPGQNAEAMMIAPASASQLAKLAQGAAWDLVSTQALAFSGPLLVAPAMNPKMWANPAVVANVALLRSRGMEIIVPDSGGTACGETGQGRLAEMSTLFYAGLRALAPKDFAGKRVLVTLGPTREYWDAVRFFSNPSSGRMGAALAVACWLRGARVVAVTGPGVDFSLPPEIVRVEVESAAEMSEACNAYWPTTDIGMFSAAVADFAPVRPKDARARKYHKNEVEGDLVLSFQRNPDILREQASHRRAGQKILAFAAEVAADMEELRGLARAKLARKGADVLAANRVNAEDSGFVSATNTMVVVDAGGREELWPSLSKEDVAWRLCTWLLMS